MSNEIIPEIYRQVIEKVIDDVREDFELNGIDESYLEELRLTWEKKLYASGVAKFGVLEPEEDDYYPVPHPISAYATHSENDLRRPSFTSPPAPPPLMSHMSPSSSAPYPFNPSLYPPSSTNFPYLGQAGRPATYMPPPPKPQVSLPQPSALPGLYVSSPPPPSLSSIPSSVPVTPTTLPTTVPSPSLKIKSTTTPVPLPLQPHPSSSPSPSPLPIQSHSHANPSLPPFFSFPVSSPSSPLPPPSASLLSSSSSSTTATPSFIAPSPSSSSSPSPLSPPPPPFLPQYDGQDPALPTTTSSFSSLYPPPSRTSLSSTTTSTTHPSSIHHRVPNLLERNAPRVDHHEDLEDDVGDEREDTILSSEKEELNSDLDDSDEDDENDANQAESTNLVLCLYEKVTRTKSKWKCIFRDGIIHIEGKDYIFHKATGDYQF